jgi:exopolysaccharide production protein ExoZ
MVGRLGRPFFGTSGVDLFFVISGFIMVITTARQEVAPLKFFSLRVVRVVPLYWLATFAMICYRASQHSFTNPYSVGDIVKSLLFVPYIRTESLDGDWPGVYPILGYAWTLNYEMFFYALFALSLFAGRSSRVAILTFALALSFATGKLFGPFDNPVAATYTSAYPLEFATGSILAYAWLRAPARISFPGSLLIIALGLYSLRDTHSRFVVTAGAFLILAGCLHPKICDLQSRALLALGDASYSIYLTHKFVVEIGAHAWQRVFPAATLLSSGLFMALTVTSSALMGWLCYRLIERPMTSKLRKLIQCRSLPAEAKLEPRVHTAQQIP